VGGHRSDRFLRFRPEAGEKEFYRILISLNGGNLNDVAEKVTGDNQLKKVLISRLNAIHPFLEVDFDSRSDNAPNKTNAGMP
jgi:hypothetical protein